MPLNRDQETVKRVARCRNTIAFSEFVLNLLESLETAEYQLRVDIENDLVKMGKMSVSELVNALDSSNKLVRSHSAMALIRIGNDSIEPLLDKYLNSIEHNWMLSFIIAEITGSTALLDYSNYCETLAS